MLRATHSLRGSAKLLDGAECVWARQSDSWDAALNHTHFLRGATILLCKVSFHVNKEYIREEQKQ